MPPSTTPGVARNALVPDYRSGMAKARSGKAVAARESVLPLLEHLVRVARRAYENEMAPGELRPRHLIALRLLDRHGPLSQQSLAEVLSLDPSNVVGLLNELEERELVTRRRDRADRRRHIVELSPAGRDEVELSNARAVIVEDALFAALDDGERATLLDLLRRAVGEGAVEIPSDYLAKSD